ncbi:MAG: DUF2325 domain-containing protein [Polyangiaceae bacterium]|nr:DUF2325 domain-containing protein [Polyangiaceae bacterium]MCL4749969.1 DUF2325 domain-containing protein [Myxococcales bacterium]
MRIGWIGGLSRDSRRLCVIAERAGHALDTHSGVVHGRGVEEIQAIVSRADLIVLVTDLNSHGGAAVTKRFCRLYGRELLVLKRCGAARFREVVSQLGSPRRAA